MTVQGPFIDGTQTQASTGEESSVLNPASGEEIARVRRASAEDVHQAVTVAHQRYRDGVKQSGFGREQGMAALEHYSEYKSVFIADA